MTNDEMIDVFLGILRVHMYTCGIDEGDKWFKLRDLVEPELRVMITTVAGRKD